MTRILIGFFCMVLAISVVSCGSSGGGGGSSTGSGTSPATPSATPTAPTAPTGVRALPGDTKVTVIWSAVADATSYNIYWSTSTGVTKATGTKITGAASPYIHSGLTNGTMYYYVVTAVNSVGESGESSETSAKPSPPAP